jgi:hypothetical protein
MRLICESGEILLYSGIMANIEDALIGPNEGQKNADKTLNTTNEIIREQMGRFKDTGPEGRLFAEGCNIFGYNGCIVTDGKISALINTEDDDIPRINLNGELSIKGGSHGYVSSGHRDGARVRVIDFIEPFYSAGSEQPRSSDKIIQVEGEGVTGWIKPSEINKEALMQEMNESLSGLFKKNQ